MCHDPQACDEAMARDEKPSRYACPDGLDPKRWCDVELRIRDLFGELRCLRCGWRGADIPQEQRYGLAGFAPVERSRGDVS